jgi:HEAT repeat protein
LGLIGDAQAVGPLGKALQDRRSEVRQEAALSLGKIGSDDAVACLIAALAHKDLETRRAAIEALGLAGKEAAVDALVPLTDDRDEPTQLAAVRALAKLGGMRAAVGLRSALESGPKAVRDAAAAALKSMRIEPAGPEDRATIAILAADFDAALREGDGAVQALIQSLGSRDPGRRLQASESLVKLGSEKSIQALLQLLRHHEPEMRDAAARALASVGVSALGGLLEALPARAQASQLLASRTAAEALEQLLRAHAAVISQEDLKRIAELPEPAIVKEDGSTEVAADCTAIRSLARQELLRRA